MKSKSMLINPENGLFVITVITNYSDSEFCYETYNLTAVYNYLNILHKRMNLEIDVSFEKFKKMLKRSSEINYFYPNLFSFSLTREPSIH